MGLVFSGAARHGPVRLGKAGQGPAGQGNGFNDMEEIMSEGRQLEVRPGDTVFVSVGEDGETHMHYMRPTNYRDLSHEAMRYAFDHFHNLDAMCSAFEQFLRGCGFSFDGHLDFVDDDGDSTWAVDVRNFLDELAQPITVDAAYVEAVRERAAELRDA